MRSIRFFLLIVAVVLPGTGFAQAWIEYTSEADLFTINFPVEPTVTEISYPSEYGAIFPGRVYMAKTDRGSYTVTVIDYRNSEQIHRERTNNTEADSRSSYAYWRIDVIASVAFAATAFRNRGGEVTYDAWHHIERVPGHQLNITNPDASRSYIGIYLHDAQLYMVEARVPEGSPPQGHFQQSLGFIDQEGKRVRYDFAEDGSLVRDPHPGQ